MKTELIEKAYAIARERYAEIGVDTEKALAALQNISLSLHCWQADDVTGFENRGGDLTGGIQATGNYPGKARNIGELRADILKAKSFIPGTHRLNLHEIYGEFGGETVDRDQVEPRHFQGWIEWAKEHGMKLDFNSTSFSHPKSGDLSLANPDPGIRDFWVEHTKRCRAIAEEMGKAQGDPSIMNLWVHDGSKDLTVNRMLYRELLRDSLDRIFETEYDHMKDSIESKVFGIGLESYTVGSNDFYIGYGASRGKIVTLDTGHFHPTEIVADKISSLLLFIPEVMLHVSRPVRWDSDHVTIMNDDTLELCKEIVRCDALDRVHIGLDYFDASINRFGAYVVGSRATQKAFLQALLTPIGKLREYEAEGKLFEISQQNMKKDYTQINPVIAEAYDLIQKAAARTDGLSGLESGFTKLDKMTSGWQNSDLIIIAARPAMGKTAFVLSMAKNIAVNFRNPVALFSLEMSNVQLVNRLISNVCEIPSEKIKSGQLADYEWQQLDYKLRDLLDAPLYVDDTPSLSVFELRTKARRLVREHGVKIIIIDYLQLMNASGMSFGSRQEEVSTISRSLKGLAKELNIPIIALSQLNRGVENREGEEGKRPQLSDLRESGAIEQDADMVCFIHRPEYYKIYTSADGSDLRGMAEIIIAKHRNGAVGDVRLRFIGQYTRFQNPEDDMVIPPPTEGGGATFGSRMNAPIGSTATPPPPSAADFPPQTDNPFGGVGSDGPLPF